ncbi:hypothetical protein C8R43DRAFT_961294 [Mycena crocata]|nr:hypothetical protein C8R43DRAFT_961294 [Mycena crocata]
MPSRRCALCVLFLLPSFNRWMEQTEWAKQIDKTHVKELRRFVARPGTKGDEPFMSRVYIRVKEYFAEANKLIEENKTDIYLLRKMNSPDPETSGISGAPLESLHKKNTLALYVFPVACLVAALLRNSPHFEFELPAKVEKALDAFRREMIKPISDRENITLHQLLMSLWTTVAKEDLHLPDPTLRFLALFSLKADGNFSGPSESIEVLGQLRWAIQMSMLAELHVHPDGLMEAFDNHVVEYVVVNRPTTFSSLYNLEECARSL